MSTLQFAAGTKLTWNQKEMLNQKYELLANGKSVGTLSWMKALGTLAEGTIGGTRYTFKRSGFWKPYVTVRIGDSLQDEARMDLHWMNDSILVFRGGARFTWGMTSMWRQEWAFKLLGFYLIASYSTTDGGAETAVLMATIG